MEVIEAEVLIVGASQAGCALGLLLAHAGVNVLAVEAQDTRERDKLCGGVLIPYAAKLFAQIYGDGALPSLEPRNVDSIDMHVFDAYATDSIDHFVLPRKQLDAYCLDRYLEAGGELLDRCRVVAIDTAAYTATVFDRRDGRERPIRYGTIVGADGANSTVRRILCGRKPRQTPSLQGTIHTIASCEISDRIPSDEGVCWYIPQGEDAVIGGLFHHANAAYCRERISQFCQKLGVELPALRGAPLPTGDDIVLRAGENAWYIGDAAGLIDPATGSGIHYALHSAQALAAELLEGTPYEASLASIVSKIERRAEQGSAANFKACLRIALAAQQQQQP